MDQTQKPPLGLLPALAKAVAAHFPELEGRSIAVSESKPFDDQSNIPRLPMVFVGLIGEQGQQPTSGGGKVTLVGDILVQFIFKPVRYTKADGKDSPFYAYYDYETIRDQLLSLTHSWRSPRNVGLQYKGMDIESDDFAVWIAFRFGYTESWCKPAATDGSDDPMPVRVTLGMCQPRSESCEPCPEEPAPPCPT